MRKNVMQNVRVVDILTLVVWAGLHLLLLLVEHVLDEVHGSWEVLLLVPLELSKPVKCHYESNSSRNKSTLENISQDVKFVFSPPADPSC